MMRRCLAGYAVLLMSAIAWPLLLAAPTLGATKAISCKNKTISADVFLIDAKGITCAKALPVAKKWLAETGYTFGADDPPTNGLVLQVSGYRCAYREISSGGAAGVQARTTCTKGGQVIRIGLGSGGQSDGKTCAAGVYPNQDPGGYFLGLIVDGVTCSTGRAVAVAYQKCRVAEGGAERGRACSKKVLGFKCVESHTRVSPLDRSAKVTCRKGKKSVIHRYQQNLNGTAA